ncbi:hypothetical protein BDK92_6742 [Micromonospora pisi]|uniref:Uncharacterized protein n=1 Tax=Micromonospora pisi TaxID=589240 RepID=A0A495JVF3_9ACTN|nr:hypothetical protein [Micromonospora pisi]RKR92304.1 hypothetical protein BDK92_6742 [Micromonospora pisi]
MDALLEHVLKANGGLDHWKSLSTLNARITYGGPFWEFKGHADFVGTETVEASLQNEHIRHVQESTGRTTVFDRAANRVTVSDADGRVIETLDDPRRTFAGYTPETQWSLAQIAYFRSYATWHYLVEPYIFSWPGVEAYEVEPWTENGETWRGLSVTFPDSIDTHNKTQLYYFDPAGHLRRMDYQPDVNGSTPVAHYIRAQESVGGIVVPTERHILTRTEDRTPDLSWIPITLELRDIKVS